MKKIYIVTFIILSTVVKSQSFSCSQFTASPTYIFYPNTTTNFTNTPSMANLLYLCGPNTAVYDTSFTSTCNGVILEANTTYIFYSQYCTGAKWIYLKNNSTLIIRPGSNVSGFGTYIYKEPTATIINQSTSTYTCTNCSSISTPSINCAASIKEYQKQSDLFNVWPNPVNNEINLTLINHSNEKIYVFIYNQLGQLVLRKEETILNKIEVGNFTKGMYYLTIKQEEFIQTKKIAIVGSE